MAKKTEEQKKDGYKRWLKNNQKMKGIPLMPDAEKACLLTPKQAKFAQGILNQELIVDAAIDAGLSANRKTAGELGNRELRKPKVIAAIQLALQQAGITPQLIADRVREGLDAKEIKFFAEKGIVSDEREVVDFSERREMVKVATNLMGADKKEKDVGGPEDKGIHISVVLNAVRKERGLD